MISIVVYIHRNCVYVDTYIHVIIFIYYECIISSDKVKVNQLSTRRVTNICNIGNRHEIIEFVQ